MPIGTLPMGMIYRNLLVDHAEIPISVGGLQYGQAL